MSALNDHETTPPLPQPGSVQEAWEAVKRYRQAVEQNPSYQASLWLQQAKRHYAELTTKTVVQGNA